jgi:dTDP-4-dehydrorhamnose reductase
VKVLVLGSGQIGTAIMKAKPDVHQAVLRSRAQLDITDDAAVGRVLAETQADWVVNAAAYTAVDRAEDEPDLAREVNDTAVAGLARAAKREGSRLLHLSTDFVFDGKAGRPYEPDHPTRAVNVYGATKCAGEKHVLEGGTGLVLRTSWVYAAVGRNFVLTMLKLMTQRENLGVVSDQFGTPTWAASVAAAVWGFIELGPAGGIYHWADLGVASWYDFAVAIQEEALVRGILNRAITIAPIPSDEYAARAARPGFSVLDTTMARALLKVPVMHWRESLRRMLDELRTA